MRARAIRDLMQLTEKALFEEVSAGLDRVFKNASQMDEDAQALWDNGRWQGSRILTAIGAEEAAKFLILIDAIRCPRDPAESLSRQLGYFSDHLAKGIYVECCNSRAASFEELAIYIRDDLRDLYLDGPNEIDWIFRNDILRQREEQMYVDYVATDDGHYWTEPLRKEFFPLRTEPAVLVLARAMHAAGFATPRALGRIAEIWRPVRMRDNFPWHELRDLNNETVDAIRNEIASQATAESYAQIVDLWPFPLHSLKLRIIPVEREELRKRQRAWSPDL